MFKCTPDVFHHLRIMADVHIVIQANQRIGLMIYCADRLLGAYHEGKHLGVAIGIVRLKIPPADLPRAEKLGGIVAHCTKPVGRCLGQFFACSSPHLLECAFQVGLGVMGST